MAEFTTEGLRRMVIAHVSNVYSWTNDGVGHSNPQRAETGDTFDRWLAAHDAAVKAEAVRTEAKKLHARAAQTYRESRGWSDPAWSRLDGMAFAYDDAARGLDQAAGRIESGEADRCTSDITLRDEEHRLCRCRLKAGHEGDHEDGEGAEWTGR